MSRSVPMYAPAGGDPVLVAPSQVETMKNRHWSLTPTDDTPPAPSKQQEKKAAAKKARRKRVVTEETKEGTADA